MVERGPSVERPAFPVGLVDGAFGSAKVPLGRIVNPALVKVAVFRKLRLVVARAFIIGSGICG